MIIMNPIMTFFEERRIRKEIERKKERLDLEHKMDIVFHEPRIEVTTHTDVFWQFSIHKTVYSPSPSYVLPKPKDLMFCERCGGLYKRVFIITYDKLTGEKKLNPTNYFQCDRHTLLLNHYCTNGKRFCPYCGVEEWSVGW